VLRLRESSNGKYIDSAPSQIVATPRQISPHPNHLACGNSDRRCLESNIRPERATGTIAASELTTVLGRALRKRRIAPNHIITDKDRIFVSRRFKRWCRRRRIRQRYGAIGKHGSISVVERFIRSLKKECTRQILVPIQIDRMRRELKHYSSWYNEYAPTPSSLAGLRRKPITVESQPTECHDLSLGHIGLVEAHVHHL